MKHPTDTACTNCGYFKVFMHNAQTTEKLNLTPSGKHENMEWSLIIIFIILWIAAIIIGVFADIGFGTSPIGLVIIGVPATLLFGWCIYDVVDDYYVCNRIRLGDNVKIQRGLQFYKFTYEANIECSHCGWKGGFTTSEEKWL